MYMYMYVCMHDDDDDDDDGEDEDDDDAEDDDVVSCIFMYGYACRCTSVILHAVTDYCAVLLFALLVACMCLLL